MNNTEKTQVPTSPNKGKKRNRRKRLFLYALCILLCLLVIPAIVIPAWLASKGIEINAISGVSFNQGLVFNEVSISINKNALTFKKLSLEHFINKDSAISNASWGLFSRQTKVRLAPSAMDALNQQGIRLSDLTLRDTTFNFTDLSEPYVFSAHASQIDAFLFDREDTAVKQRINNIDLVLTTQPSLVISGFIQQGNLNLLIPGDSALNRYPFRFDNANFSISWQPDRTPLSVHIETLNPKWPTVTEGYTQSGKNIAIGLDLDQPSDTIKLTAERLWLEQPSQLPEFIEKPDNTNQGLHLGRALANLSLLPLRKLEIHDFSYGELIIQSLLVLETPGKRASTPENKTKLRLTGKAFGPTPYDIDVLVQHVNEQDAHFSGEITGPKGNSLQCQASLHFASPLPQSLTCNANFLNTKDLTDRLKLYGMPSATLSEPLAFTVTRTAITQDAAAKPSPGKDYTPLKMPVNFNDITQARYQIDLKLPSKIKLALNQFAFQHPILSPADDEMKTISALSFLTDGRLTLNAHYQDGKLTLDLSEPSERIMVENTRHDSVFSFLIKQIHCSIELETFTAPDSLQCHTQSHFQGKISQLFPAAETKLDVVSATSDIDLKWNTRKLAMQLRGSELKIGKAQFSIHPDLIESQASDLILKAENIDLVQFYDDKEQQQLKLQLAPEAGITVSGNFYGEKLITEGSISNRKRKELVRNKSQLPVQKYNARLELLLTNSSLSQSDSQLKINTHYQTTLSLKQNNQRLPPFSSQGEISLTPDTVNVSGSLNNMKQALLAQFTVASDLTQQNTHIKLHRNDIPFNPKRTLKKHYLPHLPVKYDLNNGTISFNADLKLNQGQLSGELGFFADSLVGYIHGVHFADLNMSLAVAITPKGIKSKYPLSLHAGLLHAGVLFENIVALAEFDTVKSRYMLHRASAYALGGSISTRDVTSTEFTNISDIPIIVHRLDLEKLIQAIDLKDIELTGIVDGNFPMSIENGMPVIKSGKLRSRYPGGIFRYKEGSAINQSVDTAGDTSLLEISRILKNYKYDSLAVDIDYSKEGQLNASSRFKGYNPDFQNGQPVYVNLNIEDNIPALIKTLNVINSSKLESLFLKQFGVDE